MQFAILLPVVWFSALWLYVLVMAAKAARDRGQLTPFWRFNLAPLVPLAYAVDIFFNLTIGWIMFAELPRELLFSTRVQRHFRGSRGWQLKLAVFWARNLNVFEARHITA